MTSWLAIPKPDHLVLPHGKVSVILVLKHVGMLPMGVPFVVNYLNDIIVKMIVSFQLDNIAIHLFVFLISNKLYLVRSDLSGSDDMVCLLNISLIVYCLLFLS